MFPLLFFCSSLSFFFYNMVSGFFVIGLQPNIMSACCTLALASVLLVTAYLSADYAAYTF